jgi:arginase
VIEEGNAMTRAELIIVPFDSARREERMGRGPHALLRAGVVDRLAAADVQASVTEVAPDADFPAEIATAFELHRHLAGAVRQASAAGRLPITLSGNCNTGAVGSLAASVGEVGLVWFDAHSDAETPETSTSGFLDGMALAMVLGRCWEAMLRDIGFSPLDGSRVALVGAREISPAAQQLLGEAGVAIVSPAEVRTDGLAAAIDQLRSAGVRRVHVHVDLDVLDSETVGPANSYALPDGLSTEQLLSALATVTKEFELVSVSVASYDPEVDRTGTVAQAGLEVIATLAKVPSPG